MKVQELGGNMMKVNATEDCLKVPSYMSISEVEGIYSTDESSDAQVASKDWINKYETRRPKLITSVNQKKVISNPDLSHSGKGNDSLLNSEIVGLRMVDDNIKINIKSYDSFTNLVFEKKHLVEESCLSEYFNMSESSFEE